MHERLDWGFAHVVQAIMRDGKPLKDFMLPLGDYERSAPAAQTVEYQERVINAWIFGSNAAFAAKEARNRVS